MEPIINEILADIRGICDVETYNQINNIIVTKLNNYEIKENDKKNELVKYEMTDSQKWYQMFFIAKKIEGLSDKTLKNYRLAIDKMVRFLNKPFDEITADDIRYHLAYYQSNSRANSRTVDNERRFLSPFFQWLEDEEYIRRNPFKKIKKIKYKKTVKKAFTTEELELLKIEAEKIKKEIKRKRIIAIIEFLLSTAARAEELTNVKLSDINFDTGEVFITGKGNKERVAMLNKKAMLRFKEYLKMREDDIEYAFVSLSKIKGKNRKLEVSGLEIAIRQLGRAAGVENTHPHRFRRTCATNLMKRGMPVAEISKYLGHESIATTQLYLDINVEDVTKNCEKYMN